MRNALGKQLMQLGAVDLVPVGPGYVEPAAKKAKKEGSDKAAMGSMGSMG